MFEHAAVEVRLIETPDPRSALILVVSDEPDCLSHVVDAGVTAMEADHPSNPVSIRVVSNEDVIA